MGFGNRVWGNETVMNYLKTGVFNYWVPTGSDVHWEVSTWLHALAHVPCLSVNAQDCKVGAPFHAVFANTVKVHNGVSKARKAHVS